MTNLYIKAITTFTLLALLLSLLLRAAHAEDTAPAVSAQSAVLYEGESDTVLWEKQASLRLPMASTTKIMTALAVLSVLDPAQTVAVPKGAVGVEGSSAYLREGEIFTVEALLYALLLQSANDAAVALAIAADGTTEAFAARMNALAEQHGAKETHFENPHGLHDEAHYTTARDLAKITAAALREPLLAKIFSTKSYSYRSSLCRRTFHNHNKLLSLSADAIGVKTGFTKAGGRCLVGAAERDGLTLISVTLNAPNDWHDHLSLWEYGFSHYERRILCESGAVKETVPVSGAYAPFAELTNGESLSVLLPKGKKVSQVVDVLPLPSLPLYKDTPVGCLRFFADGREIGSVPLLVTHDVLPARIKKR